MLKNSKFVHILASLLLIGGSLFFLIREFLHNYSQIKQIAFKFDFFELLLGILFTILGYLTLTFGWNYSLGKLAQRPPLKFGDAIPVVNLPSLAKYIPGKVWSYLIQMVWLEKHGFSKAVVLFNNLLVVIVSIVASCIMGAFFFFFYFDQVTLQLRLTTLLGLLILDGIFIFGYRWCLQLAILLFNRLLKKSVEIVNTPKSVLVNLQVIFLVIYILFGMGAIHASNGFGLDLTYAMLAPLVGSIAMADTIGFLALFAPGGIGIKESIFYLSIKHLIPQNIALLIPIISRVVAIIAEIMIGCAALLILRKNGVTLWGRKSKS